MGKRNGRSDRETVFRNVKSGRDKMVSERLPASAGEEDTANAPFWGLRWGLGCTEGHGGSRGRLGDTEDVWP